MKFVFIGDIMLGRLFNMKPATYNPFGKGILNFIKKADFIIGNLETTITTSDKPVEKTFNYKMLPTHSQWLEALSLTHVNIANNHILDYGVEGLVDTRRILDIINIGYSGAGSNLKEASAPSIYMTGDHQIGVLSAANHYKEWAATRGTPGINYFNINSPASLIRQTRNAAKKVDFLIVSIHWGPNYIDEISTQMRELAHKLVDAGANVIHGTSAHHLLPVEVYKNSLIIYSNGDFIDDYAVDSHYRNDLGMMVVLDYDLNTQTINDLYTLPTIIKNLKVQLL